MRTPFVLLLAAISVCGSSSQASADFIPISNHSFEQPQLTASVFNFTIQDWTQGGAGLGGIGTWHPTAISFDLSTLDGVQNGYLNGGRIAQQLSSGLVLGETYRLSALFGMTENLAAGGFLELWAGGTVADGDVVGGALLGSLIVNDADLVNTMFIPFQTDIVAPKSGPLAGELLAIRFRSNGRESEIDNIQLSTLSAVPEPSSLAMCAGAGMVALLAAMSRRRNGKA